MRLSSYLFVSLLVAGTQTAAQVPLPPPQGPMPPPATKPAPVEKLGPNTFRIGQLTVDTARREVTATGKVNQAETLEFFANSQRGVKAYETALTIHTDAISYNAALLLIGLDPSRSRPSDRQFDPRPPQGDPVEVSVEWDANGKRRRALMDELIFDQRTKKTIAAGPFVYAGSKILGGGGPGNTPQYLAEVEGVLIGFMHGPQSIIDNPRNDTIDGYGAFVLNPSLGLTPDTAVTLIVRALPIDRKK
jgi:hypothetical protein